MKPSAQITFAERAGRALGRMWGRGACWDRKANDWLVARSVPTGVATISLWIVKLVALGVLLYVAFWLFVVLIFVLLMAAGLAQRTKDEDLWAQKDELRHGEAGYGLYSSSGQRLDPHDPNEPYDE